MPSFHRSAGQATHRHRLLALALTLALNLVARAAENDSKPTAADMSLAVRQKQHWAFQPVVRPAVPATGNPIDAFILAKLGEKNLRLSPEADRATLIRRLSFDLIGLPPTPEEVDAFVANRRADAYELLVERLLSSPRHGERWARHWLDVVRFAESDGFETNQPRPNAWPYRDWVIRAFNDDKPYDQFIREQLAGDALGVDEATGFIVGGPWDRVKSPDPVLTAQQRADELHDMVSTTGSAFLGLTVGCARCHNHKFDPVSQSDYYSVAAVFAGVQHGERPLKGVDDAERKAKAEQVRGELARIEKQLERFEPLSFVGANPPWLRAPVNARFNIERFAPVTARFVRFTITETNDKSRSEPCLDELEIWTAEETPRNVALATAGAKASSSGNYPGNTKHKLEHLNDGRHGNDRSWISNEQGKGWVQLELAQAFTVGKIIWGRDREEKYKDRLATSYRIEVATEPGAWRVVASSDDRKAFTPDAKPELTQAVEGLSPSDAAALKELLSRRHELDTTLKPLVAAPAVYAGKFSTPTPTFRLHRGDPMQKREPVSAGALAQFGAKVQLPEDAAEQARRVALASWIADARHPLTARVMVNRIWQHHFGEGIVATPSDFGLNGARPTHAELLDWLASEFMARGWSVKAMHRLIVTSATYRQEGEVFSGETASARQQRPGSKSEHRTLNTEYLRRAAAADASNRLLWHFPARRLEAEPLRDTMLAVSGVLDLRMGGPGFDLFEPNSNYVKVYNSKREFGPTEFRRMIYQNKPRMQLDETFGSFDCPDAGQITPRRTSSTTPLQALNLLNSRFIVQQADLLAMRLDKDCGKDALAQVRRAFKLAFAREPAGDELAAATKLVQEHGLPAFCRALLNANEFITVF